jgi:hypothetical protein
VRADSALRSRSELNYCFRATRNNASLAFGFQSVITGTFSWRERLTTTGFRI